ncbi:hypothetical protein GALMADRAFT_280160 [Galerina marginata CBS 339.88]|uniref:DUF6534 domain-containing protein n=1 Tax=Galerina marginata (strain CBS 339.88) TaxID=685588 RepID=A0A067T6Y2_GALM3|nr:hypothetical protein GALMADRAFT_280160 [Galerina marginata CBS 339.88]
METLRLNLNTTLGPLIIGTLISCSLFGVVIVQTYIYYTRFPDDKPLFKNLVATIWFCELGHCICICHTLYIVTVNEYGNEQALISPPKSWIIAVAFSGIIEPIVQAFFADRVRIVSKEFFIPILCWCLSGVRCIMSCAAVVTSFKSSSLPKLLHDWGWLITSLLSVGTAVDFIVTITLFYYLWKRTPNTQRSTLMIDKVIAWTIQSGLVTTCTGLAMLLSFLVAPYTYIWLGIFVCLSRIFSTSMLASLNGRTFPNETSTIALQEVVTDSRYLKSSPYKFPMDNAALNRGLLEQDFKPVLI